MRRIREKYTDKLKEEGGGGEGGYESQLRERERER